MDLLKDQVEEGEEQAALVSKELRAKSHDYELLKRDHAESVRAVQLLQAAAMLAAAVQPAAERVRQRHRVRPALRACCCPGSGSPSCLPLTRAADLAAKAGPDFRCGRLWRVASKKEGEGSH